ncbi:family 20 glycosylhydrolase [Virgibacillus halodenitrificans]|uniref:family 20 glycosylhydrolase n=1 Tax=Virgibacillus halodenitrificans TaxID=1482 RepID=UPI001EEEB0FD|nr:family 20 glycosylhydrolase [Virgibacillus halodenitrificans]MCG1027177.1 family 20 glycosylhydrolase [Virgibacillus halodenitrificans]
MKKWIVLLFCILLIVFLRPSQEVKAKEPNAKPKVIPSLQEWSGSEGFFTLSEDSRIIVDLDGKEKLMNTANVFQKDLKEMTGSNLPIETAKTPAEGDFFLTLTEEKDQTIGDEGYHFVVENAVTIRANTKTGVFYGTRTALQILVQDPTKKKLPNGTAKDYPKYGERGFMLDVGRKYFPMEFLKDYAKVMAWYKMNDFQLHLNDNAIFKDNDRSHWDKYSAFRMESDTYPKLTAEDGHYSKAEFRELQDLAEVNGLMITPEFDTPSHSLALTKLRPDLVHPDLPVDHLDITRQETVDFIKSVWDEYYDLFSTETVHIGADEFYRNDKEMSNVYRNFINTLNDQAKSNNKKVRAWGGLSYYKGDVVVDKDVTFNIWNVGWYNPNEAVNSGYNIINSDDGLLYIVPKAGYYHDYLDTKWLYNNWEPTIFSGGIALEENNEQVLGGMFALWNDMLGKKVSISDAHDRISKAMPTLAEKMWRGHSDETTFSQFQELTSEIGVAPGTNLDYNVKSKTDKLIDYPFDEEKVIDHSGNNYDGEIQGAKLIKEGKQGNALLFSEKTDHVTTEVDTKGFPWTVSAWVKLEDTKEPEAVLMESSYSSLKFKQKETGNAGFTREGFDFSFNTAVPTGRWVHVAFRGDLKGTSLFIDGELKDTLADNTLLPVQTIGSKTNSFTGVLDELQIYNRYLSTSEIAEVSNAPVWTINTAAGKKATASSNETEAFTPNLAVDENDTTRWASGYTDDEWIYVDLLDKQPINKVVLNWENAYGKGYKIQVSNDAESWKDVYSTENGDGGKDIIHFPEENARYVRMKGTERAIDWGFSLYEFEVYQPVTASEMIKWIEQLQDRSEITNQTARKLSMHMTTVSRYADEQRADKVLKHVEGFLKLNKKLLEEGHLTDEVYEKLKAATIELQIKWQMK